MKTPRIFQIGYNRCGTTSIHAFLIRGGLKSVHHKRGEELIATNMQHQLDSDQDPCLDFPNINGFTDMEVNNESTLEIIEMFKNFEQIYRFHPDAWFILNTRDLENWVMSRALHRSGRLLEFHKARLGGCSDQAVFDFWRQDWKKHHEKVIDFFSDNPNFFIFNIEKDNPEKLSHFLKDALKRLPAEFPHKNTTNSNSVR